MRTLRANIATLMSLTIIVLISALAGCASQPSPGQSADQAPSSKLVAIASVTASQTEDGVEVLILADGPLTFSSLKQPDPLAVVLYFPETSVDQAKVTQPDGNSPIARITTRQGNGQRTARLEIQLAADASYTAFKEGNAVRVNFRKSDVSEAAAAAPAPETKPAVMAPAAQTEAPASAAAVAVPQEKQINTDEQPAAMSAAAPTAPASKTTAWVNKIDFLSESEGKSTLMVATTHAVDYRINKVAPQRIEIRLLNTKIPSYHQRPLITTRFNSAVDRVLPLQPDKAKNESVIAIELRQAVPYVTEQTDTMLFVHFEASNIPPKPLEQAELPAWKQVLSGPESVATVSSEPAGTAPVSAPMAMASPSQLETQPAARADVEPIGTQTMTADEQAVEREDAEMQAMVSPRRKNFTGEKIALDFYETDIKNVFRILREVSGKNFAIDKDVTGKVTMTLDKPVPWDQVLDLVLRMNQLGMVHEGDIVRIATLETLKREDDLRRAKMEAYRKAREEVKALEPLITRYIPVSYSNAKSEVKPHIELILTKERGSVTVDDKNNQIIITDTAEKVKQAQEIIRRIDKVTAQVVIEGRVVEVTDNFSRELGINWSMNYGPGMLGDWTTSTDMAMNFPSQASSNIGIGFSRLSGVPFVLNARINALETTGEGKILSSPKILTLDNKKAKIKQGVEVGYLERDSSGGSSVKFKNVDLLLEVTPHVTPDNRISLIIYITKNDVASIINGVPSVASNEAQTELLVNDGDTIVIGGIIKATETKGENGFPLLSKIPVLGWAFKNTSKKLQSNELLIFITPRIVQLEQVAER